MEVKFIGFESDDGPMVVNVSEISTFEPFFVFGVQDDPTAPPLTIPKIKLKLRNGDALNADEEFDSFLRRLSDVADVQSTGI